MNTAETAVGVRVMHLGVGAPGVDIFVDGTGPIIQDLQFRNSTEYSPVPPGEYTFQVSVTGTPAEEAVLEPMLGVDADTSYTVVAIGDLAQTDGAPPLQILPLVDSIDGIGPDDVRITVVHAAPAVGEVDIWEISEEPVLLLENVPFAGAATLDDLPAGPLQIGVDLNDDQTPEVTFDVDTTGLGSMQINAYANNDTEGNVSLVAQLPDATVLTIPAN